MCVLLGYGADAVCPYLVFEISQALRKEGVLDSSLTDDVLYRVSFICSNYYINFAVVYFVLPYVIGRVLLNYLEC